MDFCGLIPCQALKLQGIGAFSIFMCLTCCPTSPCRKAEIKLS